MPSGKSEIPIQLLVDDLDLLREMYGSETPQKGQIVEIDGYSIEFRGISRTHGMTQQEITILIAINVGTSVLSSATTVLLGFWIFSRLSREGRFPVLIGDDLIIKSTSSEIADALTASFSTHAKSVSSNSDGAKRFAVALTFPGEHRNFVESVANLLSEALSKPKVFYDRYHEPELARPNLDTYLQDIYHDHSDLIVVFLCEAYAEKEWCILEFRAVRSLIKKCRDDQIMFVRLDDGAVQGVFDIDGYLDARGQNAEYVCSGILDRLHIAKAIPDRISDRPQAPKETFASIVHILAKQKPHSICFRLLGSVLRDRVDRWLLIRCKDTIDTMTFGQMLADADAMLISSDLHFAGVQAMQVAKGISLLGRGLCTISTYSSSLERLFAEVADLVVRLTNASIECDSDRWSEVLWHCDRGDLTAAVQAVGVDPNFDAA